MGRLDDHHHRNDAERRAMQAHEAQREARQRGQPELAEPQPEVSPADTRVPVHGREAAGDLTCTGRLRAIGGAFVDQADFIANDTVLGDVLPPEVGPAISAGRTAAKLYDQRELIAADARNAAKHVKEGLAGKGREVGEAMGRSVEAVYGRPFPDPLTQAQIDEAMRHEERLKRRGEHERQRSGAQPLASEGFKHRLAAKGREVGEAMGRAVQEMAGPTPGPFIELEANGGQGCGLQREQDGNAPRRPQFSER